MPLSDEMTPYQKYLANKPRRAKPKKKDGPTKFRMPSWSKKKGKEAGAKKRKKGEANKRKEADSPEVLEQRLIEHVRATRNPEVAVKYQTLLGSVRPVARALMCNRPLLKEAEDHIVGEVRKCLAAGSLRFGVQTTRVLVTPGDRANISVADTKKPRSFYDKANLDGIAALRICPVPSVEGCRFAIAEDVVAVFWGRDAEQKLEHRLRRTKPGSQLEQSPVQWFESDDLESLRQVVGSMLLPPFNQLPHGDLTSPAGSFHPHATKGDRALITFMCRSQLPVRKALMHFGAGKPIIAGALAKMDHTLKTRCKAAAQVLHEDEVAHFLFEELRRLDMENFSVPVVKLR